MKYKGIENELKLKRTIFVSIGFIGILFAIGIMLAMLPLNSSAAIPTASDNSAVTAANSQAVGANAAPFDPTMRMPPMRAMAPAERNAAAARIAILRQAAGVTIAAPTLVPGPTGILVPDYFGTTPNFANSPLPNVDPATGVISGGMRKFVDSLPGLGVPNNLGQYIPIAVNDSTTYPGSDYYEIALVQYTEKMHSDLNITTLRGYVQLETPANAGISKHIALTYPNGSNIMNASGAQVFALDIPHYLGPIIISQRDIPVRVKFINYLPAGAGGDLFIPVDSTIMGAGMGPLTPAGAPCNPSLVGAMCDSYKQNRATLHLHGGNTPWISDGTQHQWTTPGGEVTAYPKGVSVGYVPDMWFDSTGTTVPAGTPGATNNPGNGSLTFYYTNQQSARLMFYHDHAYGITRLNVYAGEAAAYLVRDQPEQALIASGVIPVDEIPLVIQDKTFLPGATRLAAQDPTWNWGKNYTGDLWFPHVYMTNQNPFTPGGANAMGRWDYGPWFWPVFPVTNGMVPNPYYDPIKAPWEPPMIPGTPNPSLVPEAFMDTPVVNGNAYPNLSLQPKAYRFRILNAGNDRMLNLQLYYAATAGPIVVINSSDGNGMGASATAAVAGGVITTITVTSGGVGYTAAPNVSIFDAPGHTPAGTGATASATIDPLTGMVTAITVTNGGTGYSVPTICKGTGASNLCTEVSMVPANPAVPGCSIMSWPAGWPTPDGRVGGWPDPNAIGPSMIQIGTEGGFLPNATVIPNRPIGYDYNRRSITVLNVLEKALFLGPAERADVIVDFSTVPAGSTLILYNDAPAPVPGFDPRNDYYTGDPDLTTTGGAPSTLPGYGPNTRTIMQIQVAGAPAAAFDLAALQAALPVAYNQSQDKPIVPQAAYNAAFKANYPADAYVHIQDTSINFTPAGSTVSITMPLQPKSIIEDFDVAYGRMNAMLGVEVPKTSANTQTTIPYYDIDPPTEIIKNSNASALIGTLGDGTQIWKITHNGVDTHAMHWHMFNVQLINRVGWDGSIRPPDPNELGWKETVRMNPLEDIIVALRPIKPVIPWDLPNSIRPLDVTMPLGVAAPLQFHNVDPTNQPAIVINHMVNYGWEYVWHCHLLGHEENIMMRPVAFVVAPMTPSNLTATVVTSGVKLTWRDNSKSETSFTIQRATNAAGPWTTIKTVPSTTGKGTGATVAYIDATVLFKTTYYYRVMATNVVGDTTIYTAPAVGYPHTSSNSPPSKTAIVST